jgi:hypothetical protein
MVHPRHGNDVKRRSIRDEAEMKLVLSFTPASYALSPQGASLRRRGVTIRSTIDCVIAQLGDENDALILSKDRDLRHILDSGLLNAPPLPLS